MINKIVRFNDHLNLEQNDERSLKNQIDQGTGFYYEKFLRFLKKLEQGTTVTNP